MNKVMLLGRIVKDLELKNIGANNTSVCNFTLAVNRSFVKQGEERQADFVNCQVWGKLADAMCKFLAKGSQIAVYGRLQTRNREDNEGKKHYITEVVVEEFYFADSKKSEQTNNTSDAYEPESDDTKLPF